MFEDWVERQIREAAERGAFDNLPGAGKPLRLRYPDDPDWWVRSKIEDEHLDAVLPAPLTLRRAKQDILATLADVRDEATARAIIADLNDRIRAAMAAPQSGPPIVVGLLDAEETIAAWRASKSS
ncbi:MAG: DUF1992 domain-containing protein [Propionibacteriaceae bacterium]|jgi:hypothetical protein|nr:DUF1992 domain-containing protein [Propionibacteriaceae bacterium]